MVRRWLDWGDSRGWAGVLSAPQAPPLPRPRPQEAALRRAVPPVAQGFGIWAVPRLELGLLWYYLFTLQSRTRCPSWAAAQQCFCR